KSIPFNMEADSLNCCVLGESVEVSDPEFDLFIKEVVREMTVKAGQKCTAIRRVLVPKSKVQAVTDALKQRLAKVVMGDPLADGVTMGPLITASQKNDVQRSVASLLERCELQLGGSDDFEVMGEGVSRDAFYLPTLLFCKDPLDASSP